MYVVAVMLCFNYNFFLMLGPKFFFNKILNFQTDRTLLKTNTILVLFFVELYNINYL